MRQVRNDNDYSPLSNAIIILSQLMAVEKDQEYAKMTVNALIRRSIIRKQ